jgi:LytS/YehU family sensor histidine kinase
MILKMPLTRANIRRSILILLLSTLLGLVFFFQSYLRNISLKPADQSRWQDLLFLEVIAFYLYAVLSIFIFKLARRYPLHQHSWRRLLLIHVPASLVFASVHLLAHSFLGWSYMPGEGWTYSQFMVGQHIICTYRILWRVLVYFAILAAYYAFDFYRRSRVIESKALELESELKRAKLEGLKSQLSPDLLFDTLHDVARMLQQDVERADRLIARLGSFLRSCLEAAGKSVVALSHEIELLIAYAEIQKIRLENQLEIRIEIHPDSYDLAVPNLFLFQVVESLILKTKELPPPKTLIQVRITHKHRLVQVEIVREISFISENLDFESSWKEIDRRIHGLYSSIANLETELQSSGRILIRMNIPLEEEQYLEAQPFVPHHPMISLEEFRQSIRSDTTNTNIWFKKPGVRIVLNFAIWSLLAFYFQAREFHNAKVAIVWKELFLSLVPWYIWAFATPLVFFLQRHFPLQRGRLLRNFPVHLVASLAIWFIVTVGNAIIWSLVEPTKSFSMMLGQSLFYSRIAINILIYWSLTAIASAAANYGKYREGELRGLKLQIKIMEAQLQAIRMQLQPHFLFNTLNSISELMHENVQGAVQMLKRLEDFLRLTLRNDARSELTLREEIEFLECYLEIQQMRFQDRLKVDMKIDESALENLVPSLLCQPIIENAIRHGISPMIKDGHIEIIAKRENGMLSLEIKDNGPGLPPSGHWKEGFGLSNTRAMLVQLYGDRHLFRLQNSSPQGGLTVTLKIPATIPKTENTA